MVIEKLKDSIVFLDSAPLIYFIGDNSDYQVKLENLFRLNDEDKHISENPLLKCYGIKKIKSATFIS